MGGPVPRQAGKYVKYLREQGYIIVTLRCEGKGQQTTSLYDLQPLIDKALDMAIAKREAEQASQSRTEDATEGLGPGGMQ